MLATLLQRLEGGVLTETAANNWRWDFLPDNVWRRGPDGQRAGAAAFLVPTFCAGECERWDCVGSPRRSNLWRLAAVMFADPTSS